MHLAALVESEDHVCCRYRLRAFQAGLKQSGHSLEFHELPQRWWGKLGIARSLQAADAVILQRKLLSPWELALVRRRVGRLIFDFDDSVWIRDSYAPKGFDCRKRARRFRALMRQCDAVVAGNSYLARHAQEQGARETIVVPTCVDWQQYPIAPHTRSGGQAQLVWVGSSSTLRGLETIRPILEAIGSGNPGIELKLICDRFLNLRNLTIQSCVWSEQTETNEIAAADIGIAWVPDDPWSKGKCGLKVLQYMSAGLPVIANPVGVHLEMVEPGVTGFLAQSESDWVEAVRALTADPSLRQKMGSAGRERVRRRYSVDVGVRGWVDFLNRLAQQRVRA